MLEVNNKLWIWSDTHFGHKNIVKFQQRPETHEEIMLSNWIRRVENDDSILHLGDVFLGKQGNPGRWADIISRMPGRKYLLKGNHDKADNSLYEQATFEIVTPFTWVGKNGTILFTHEPVRTGDFLADTHWDVNIHGHIHGNSLDNPDDPASERPILDRMYINMSVEVIDFTPVALGNIYPV